MSVAPFYMSIYHTTIDMEYVPAVPVHLAFSEVSPGCLACRRHDYLTGGSILRKTPIGKTNPFGTEAVFFAKDKTKPFINPFNHIPVYGLRYNRDGPNFEYGSPCHTLNRHDKYTIMYDILR